MSYYGNLIAHPEIKRLRLTWIRLAALRWFRLMQHGYLGTCQDKRVGDRSTDKHRHALKFHPKSWESKTLESCMLSSWVFCPQTDDLFIRWEYSTCVRYEHLFVCRSLEDCSLHQFWSSYRSWYVYERMWYIFRIINFRIALITWSSGVSRKHFSGHTSMFLLNSSCGRSASRISHWSKMQLFREGKNYSIYILHFSGVARTTQMITFCEESDNKKWPQ